MNHESLKLPTPNSRPVASIAIDSIVARNDIHRKAMASDYLSLPEIVVANTACLHMPILIAPVRKAWDASKSYIATQLVQASPAFMAGRVPRYD